MSCGTISTPPIAEGVPPPSSSCAALPFCAGLANGSRDFNDVASCAEGHTLLQAL